MELEYFSEDVLAKLGNYVYAYVKEDGTIFYIGRGSTKSRAVSHLTESCNDDKSHNWSKLNEIDENTQVYIVHSGMNEDEAKHCETALINLCCFLNPNLTNIKDGDKFSHKMLSVDVIQNMLTEEPILLEEIFKPENYVAVLAYSDKNYFKSPILSEEFFERVQHEDGFRLATHYENDYIDNLPKILCVVHDKVIRGVFSVESEILKDYNSRDYAFAYITFELESYKTIPTFEQYIGRKIEKRKSKFTIKENMSGTIHFLY